jgi:hypothetical protein
VSFRRLSFGLVGLAALAAAGLAPSVAARPPSPVQVAQLGATIPPQPTATPAPRRGRRSPGSPGPSTSAGPTDSPVPAQFSTLDGIWEVELQAVGANRTQYSHLKIVQNGNTVGGYWQHDPHLTHSAFTGTFDGRLFQLVIDLGSGKSATMSGYAENFSDFVGMLRMSDGTATPFTAEHRRKERPQ